MRRVFTIGYCRKLEGYGGHLPEKVPGGFAEGSEEGAAQDYEGGY
jgi:hypothetical protein